jgi:hypothetical protein
MTVAALNHATMCFIEIDQRGHSHLAAAKTIKRP